MFSILEFELAYIVPFLPHPHISYTNVKNQSQFRNYDNKLGVHIL